jgi:hypothetical protein
MVSGIDMIAKTARLVRHASRLLRVGLRGVDDERVKVILAFFPLSSLFKGKWAVMFVIHPLKPLQE